MFQKKVGLHSAIGVPGAFASINPLVSASLGKFAEGEVKIGGFCWYGSDDDHVKSSGAGAPFGFVVRNVTNPIENFRDASQDFIPEDYPVAVQMKGDFFVVTSTAATVGQKVFANTTDGTISTGAAGATIADHVETNYQVTQAGDADEVIVIANW